MQPEDDELETSELPIVVFGDLCVSVSLYFVVSMGPGDGGRKERATTPDAGRLPNHDFPARLPAERNPFCSPFRGWRQ